ncbi:hypothetical protein ACSLVN_27825, partial [Klebsiella pneumoniae]|uniref:hypothetical protein n=1 Tax=Klebsiella pneumoniae TaxID=573 RepID=UPI003EDF6D22
MLLERIDEDRSFGSRPLAISSLENYWFSLLLTRGIDDEVAFVVLLVFDDAIHAPILDALVT